MGKKSNAKTPKPIGMVTHFYDRIGVGIVKVKAPMRLGDTLRFHGRHGEFTQPIRSMQFMHQAIEYAPKGKEIGIKLNRRVYEKDLVYLVK